MSEDVGRERCCLPRSRPTRLRHPPPPALRPPLRAGLDAAAGLGTLTFALAHAGGPAPALPIVGADIGRPDPQTQAVLDQLAALHPLPLPALTPEQARNIPTVADAVQAVQAARGLAPAVEPVEPVEPVGSVGHTLIPGPGGQLLVRVYTPRGADPFPVVVYFHGGGFVIATLDTYDASCRALCNAAHAVVLSVAYRQASKYNSIVNR